MNFERFIFNTSLVIKVGGRLCNHTSLSYNQKKKTMLLSNNPYFIKEGYRLFPFNYFSYWTTVHIILDKKKKCLSHGRSQARQQLRKCFRCLKFNQKLSPQLMGDLPASRIMQIRILHTVGVDYAGPSLTK